MPTLYAELHPKVVRSAWNCARFNRRYSLLELAFLRGDYAVKQHYVKGLVELPTAVVCVLFTSVLGRST